MLFKILILQKHYNLSDEKTELQIGDKIPYEKTICLFKEQIKEKQLAEDLFNLFAGQLLGQGIIDKEGNTVRRFVTKLMTKYSVSGTKK